MANFGNEVNFDLLMKSVVNDEILIGYPDGLAHNKADMTLDELAKKHCEGEGVPKRAFLEDGIETNRKEIETEIKKQWTNMFQGKSQNYHRIGVLAINGVQEFVRGEYYRTHSPNAETTILAKTSQKMQDEDKWKDKPLIDTGQMINGVTYTVGRSK
jgi:hypothetical protein